MDYEIKGYEESDIVQVTAHLNGKLIPDLSLITHRSKAMLVGKQLVHRLNDLVPRQQYDVAIQAMIGHTVIARATIKQYRKDVTAKLYGGDATRRMKLLENQKKGKKKLKALGNVQLDPKAFIAILTDKFKDSS